LSFPGPPHKEGEKEMRRTTAPLFIGAAMAAALAASILIVMVLIAASSEPAQAAFPGTNGKIAFVTNRDGNLEIYTMNPDGTSQENISRSSATETVPAYSANGENIAFLSTRDGNGEIYKMTSTGTLQTQLTDNPAGDQDHAPSWGPLP
jgi:hypothetical protein